MILKIHITYNRCKPELGVIDLVHCTYDYLFDVRNYGFFSFFISFFFEHIPVVCIVLLVLV